MSHNKDINIQQIADGSMSSKETDKADIKSDDYDGHHEGGDNDDDEANMDPKKLIEKWKKTSLAQLREETQRGIALLKRELTEKKEKELNVLRKENEILRSQLVAEKGRKDRSKQREQIEREVQLQTELAKQQEELSVLHERLLKADKVSHCVCIIFQFACTLWHNILLVCAGEPIVARQVEELAPENWLGR